MQIEGSVALVTGANRGLGQAFVTMLLRRGARVVYGCARDPGDGIDPRATPVELDITDASDVTAAAARCRDVSLVVNNAALAHRGSLLAAPTMEIARTEMETNYFGTLAMCRAFAPVLGRQRWGSAGEHAVDHVVLQLSGNGVLVRDEGGNVVADQRRTHGAPRAGHARRRRALGLHRHPVGRWLRRPETPPGGRGRTGPRRRRGRLRGGACRRAHANDEAVAAPRPRADLSRARSHERMRPARTESDDLDGQLVDMRSSERRPASPERVQGSRSRGSGFHQPRLRHSGTFPRSTPSVVSSPWPG